MTIGEKIRYRRQQMGFSVRDLAEKVGVSHGALSKWENNQTKGIPDPQLRKELSRSRPFELSKEEISVALKKALDLTIMGPRDLIDAFVHKVVLSDQSMLIEFNLTEGEGLKTSDLLRFDQKDKWWSIGDAGRTLTIYRGRVLALCPW